MENNEFKIYKGVVEDNNDPEQRGRVRVRVLGVHSENLTDVPINTLPWAQLMHPLGFGGFISNIGMHTYISNGTWVWLTFDHNDVNYPIIMGGVSGINTTKTSGEGFSDPDGVYPLSEKLSLPDMNLRGLGENYTKVHTIETPGHHIIEIDDAKEEMRLLHNNGSEILINPNNILITSVTDRTEVTIGKFQQTVMQSIEINADGNIIINTAKKMNISVNGDTNISTNGNTLVQTVGNTTVNTNGNTLIDTKGTTDVKSVGIMTLHTDANLNATVTGNLSVIASGTGHIESTGAMMLKGSQITLQGGSTVVI